MRITADFHVHSYYSDDSVITFPLLLKWCEQSGVDVVAIMDHDRFEGAVEFKRLSEERRSAGVWAPKIIPGQEIRTARGEICGLFLKEHIPAHLPPDETMKIIRSQGGLVYVPHPFDLLKIKRLKASELAELSGLVDIIEVINGKPRFPAANILAQRFVRNHPFTLAAGSDAHEPTKIGAVRVLLDEFDTPEELMQSLRGARIEGRMYSPFGSAFVRLYYRRKYSIINP